MSARRVLGGLALLAGLVAGCGSQSGVAENATVTIYAAAPLCAGAERELERSHGRAGDVHVQVTCLEDFRKDGRIDLATIGANARRASEDTTTVAYIGEVDPGATRFSSPILESADIPQVSNQPGSAAMARILRAIRESDTSGSLRESVGEALE